MCQLQPFKHSKQGIILLFMHFFKVQFALHFIHLKKKMHPKIFNIIYQTNVKSILNINFVPTNKVVFKWTAGILNKCDSGGQ